MEVKKSQSIHQSINLAHRSMIELTKKDKIKLQM